MQAYEISKNEQAAPVFAGDLRAVRDVVRTINKESRDWARVYLIQFPTAKADLLGVLNGQELQRTRVRAWRLSIRGRLLEIGLDE